MRTALVVCAALANLAVAAQLQAQNCRTSCSNCPNEVSDISIMFDGTKCGCAGGCAKCGCAKCGSAKCGCPQDSCGQQGCDPGGYEQGGCVQAGCNEDGCAPGQCAQDGGNQGDCDPYTYYQLRQDWKNTHGPVCDTLRYIHQSCPKKHHVKHNGNEAAYRRSRVTPWHGPYYYPQWGGAPVALVVPPTAQYQTNYSWGVPASRIQPIDAQFSRYNPGSVSENGPGVPGAYGFMPPPLQPSDTMQFGVYYVRGPW